VSRESLGNREQPYPTASVPAALPHGDPLRIFSRLGLNAGVADPVRAPAPVPRSRSTESSARLLVEQLSPSFGPTPWTLIISTTPGGISLRRSSRYSTAPRSRYSWNFARQVLSDTRGYPAGLRARPQPRRLPSVPPWPGPRAGTPGRGKGFSPLISRKSAISLNRRRHLGISHGVNPSVIYATESRPLCPLSSRLLKRSRCKVGLP